jgi:hypothetical protein
LHTIFRCKHDHPVQAGAKHGAHCGAQSGVWEFTGNVFTEANSEVHPRQLVPRPDHHLAYCQVCKSATEYKLVTSEESAA